MRGATSAAIAFVAVAACAALLASRGCDEDPAAARRDAGVREADAAHGGPAGDRSHRRATPAGTETEPEPTTAEPSGAPGRVSGRVVDDWGEPIAGAVAQVWIPRGRRGSTHAVLTDTVDGDLFGGPVRSDADGRFEAAFPPEGRHRILFTHPGHASVVEHAGAGDEDVEAVLSRLVAVTFRVVDAAHAPIAGAEIRWTADDEAPPSTVARTGKDGRAEVAVPGTALVVARAAGYATSCMWSAAHEDPGAERVLVLLRGLPLAGLVVDPEGRPVAGAFVRLHRDPRFSSLQECVRTDEQGRFAFDAVGAGAQDSYRLETWRVVSGSVEDAEARGVPGDLEVRLVLRRWGEVRGVVVDGAGRPVARAVVGPPPSPSHPAGEEGAFVLRMEAGSRVLAARAPWPGIEGAFLEGRVEVNVPDGPATEGVRVVVGPPAVQSFVEIECEAVPLQSREKVVAIVTGGGLRERETGLRAGGSRVVAVPAPAGAVVTIRAAIHNRPDLGFSPEVEVMTSAAPPGTTVRLRFSPAPRLRVRVVDAAGERTDLLDDVVVADGRTSVGRTPDGTWAIDPARPVSVSLRVGDPAGGRATLAPPHPAQRDVDLLYVPGTTVRARFVGEDGKPATSNRAARLAEPEGSWNRTCAVGEGGVVTFRDAGPGPAVVTVQGDRGRWSFRWEVVVPAGPAADLGDLVVTTERWFEGRVTDVDGRGIGGAVVSVGTKESDVPFVTASSAPDGTFRMPLRPMAGLVCRVTKSGYGVGVAPVGHPGTACVVTLGPAGRILVRFRRPPEGGLDGWWLREPRTRTTLPERSIASTSDAEAAVDDWRSWTVGDLPAGDVDVVVRTLAGREIVRTVVVVPGETVVALFDE